MLFTKEATLRFLTTEGPVTCTDHYCLPPLERLDLAEVRILIDQQKCFAIHAPPRSGETTHLLALAEHLKQAGRYRVVYASSKLPKADGSDSEDDTKNLTEQIARAAKAQVCDSDALAIAKQVNTTSRGFSMLGEFLTLWCKTSRLPTVLLLDDLQVLARDTLFTLLRQLRSRHPQRPTDFPQSIILCGVHDIRDYGIHLSSGQAFRNGSSVFNIKAASLGLDDFRPAQVKHLLLQYANDTGQIFTLDAQQMVFDLTQGQPWLVNALARQAVQVVVPDPVKPVDLGAIAQAKEFLIQRRTPTWTAWPSGCAKRACATPSSRCQTNWASWARVNSTGAILSLRRQRNSTELTNRCRRMSGSTPG